MYNAIGVSSPVGGFSTSFFASLYEAPAVTSFSSLFDDELVDSSFSFFLFEVGSSLFFFSSLSEAPAVTLFSSLFDDELVDSSLSLLLFEVGSSLFCSSLESDDASGMPLTSKCACAL